MRGPKLVGTLLGIGVLALVLAGCGHLFPPGHGSPRSGITIVAPGDHTQVPRDGRLDVIVRLDRPLAASTLRLEVVAGGHAPIDVTARLHPVALGFGATLTAADLSPGINRIVANARGAWHGAGRRYASATVSWEPAVDTALSSRCDFLGQSRCLLPFPNDWFTTRDPTTDTGRRVQPRTSRRMTANVAGVHIDPADWNRNDGFSPGAMILASVPGIDLATHGCRADHRHRPLARRRLARSCCSTRRPGSAGRSSPSSTPTPRPTRTAPLIIRPAKNLLEGHRYVVALRRA